MNSPAPLRPSSPRSSAAVLGAVLALFFISGACGLVYEVVWTRLLRLVMGNTVFSITTVLCAFMGGLAAGSYLAGRIADRRSDPLRLYAVLEAVVGLYCLLLPWVIQLAQPLYRVLYRDYHNSYLLFGLVRFVFCGSILLIPATFMGATLPILSRFVAHSGQRLGAQIGRLYAVNTFGAVLGAAGAGFVLIPHLGVTWTIRLACAANLLVALAAYLLYRRSPLPPLVAPAAPPAGPKRPAAVAPPAVVSPPGRAVAWAVWIGYGLSGMAALAYEVAWSRALSLAISSSVYAFSLMLTAFILGLAVGSIVSSRFADRWRDPVTVLAVAELGIAVSALAASPVFGWLPLHFGRTVLDLAEEFWKLQILEFGVVLAVMLVPTLLMGVAFPLAARAYAAARSGVGRPVGSIYAANTLGAILGSFLAGFVVIPLVGIRGTILAAVTVNLLVGLVLLVPRAGQRRMWRGVVGAAAVGAVLMGSRASSAWDVATLTFGPYWYARISVGGRTVPAEQAEQAARSSEILYHKEGAFDTITIRRAGGNRILCINGKPDASSGPDMPTQLLLGHLPMLLHGRADRVLVIGLASGVTLGATSLYPASSLDCVDISPDMPEATHFFDDVNHNVLSDPRLKLFIADGRNHLALTERKYDVIVSEPSNPWIAGIADLFTREFFTLARRRLNEGGVVGIWVQSYGMETRAFWSIAKAFAEVFPYVTLWHLEPGDTMLIGSTRPFHCDLQRLRAEFDRDPIRRDLAAAGVRSPEELLAQYLMDADAVAAATAGVPAHTDDNALVEFSTPRSMFDPQAGSLLTAALNAWRGSGLERLLREGGANPETIARITRMVQSRKHFAAGVVHVAEKQEEAAYNEYRLAHQLDPSYPMLAMLRDQVKQDIRGLAAAGKLATAERVAQYGLEVFPGDAELHFFCARLSYLQGKSAQAAAQYALALEARPDWPEVALDLAWILATTNDSAVRDGARAVRLARQGSPPQSTARSLDVLAAALAETGQFDQAVTEARRALELARKDGQWELVAPIEARIASYQAKTAHRER